MMAAYDVYHCLPKLSPLASGHVPVSLSVPGLQGISGHCWQESTLLAVITREKTRRCLLQSLCRARVGEATW